jgi:hypothetical protein
MKRHQPTKPSKQAMTSEDLKAIRWLGVMGLCTYFIFVVGGHLLSYFDLANSMSFSQLWHSRGFLITTFLIVFLGGGSLYVYLWARFKLKHLDSGLIRKYFPWLNE